MTSYLAHDPPRAGAAATTANCRFSAVFEATKLEAYRAMADISFCVGVTGRFAFLSNFVEHEERKRSWYWQLKGKKQQRDDDALDEEFQRESKRRTY